MFSLSDLKHTRFYQDVFAEGQVEAKQREKSAIFRIFSMGFATEDIATIFDLPVAEVAAIITESQKEQAEQGEQN